jgi:hypothetical protein
MPAHHLTPPLHLLPGMGLLSSKCAVPYPERSSGVSTLVSGLGVRGQRMWCLLFVRLFSRSYIFRLATNPSITLDTCCRMLAILASPAQYELTQQDVCSESYEMRTLVDDMLLQAYHIWLTPTPATSGDCAMIGFGVFLPPTIHVTPARRSCLRSTGAAHHCTAFIYCPACFQCTQLSMSVRLHLKRFCGLYTSSARVNGTRL